MQELRLLGHSNLSFSPLGLGTWQFSNKDKGRTWWRKIDDQTVYDIIKVSLDGGINWLDTAEVYGRGNSEKFIGRNLQRLGSKEALGSRVYIADKWFPLLRSADTIPETIKTRLDYLQRDSIDLYQIHQPTSLSSLYRQLRELAKLHEMGFINAIGVSNFTARQMEKADDILQRFGLRLSSNQVKYNLLHRKPEKNGVLELAKERGISIIAYSPLQQGVLTGRFHDNPESIQEISKVRRMNSGLSQRNLIRTQPLIDLLKRLGLKYGKSPAQISLNWLIKAHGETVFAIPGASSRFQARSNLEAQCFELSQADIEQLNHWEEL